MMKKNRNWTTKILLALFFMCSAQTLYAENITIDVTNFPDENFRNYLLEQDYGADGMLTEEEIAGITRIEVSSRDISSLKGIEFFMALEQLYCNNNQLTDLDVSNNAALTHLFCDVNPLTALDVSNNLSLTFFSCSGNQLTSLDVSRNTALTYLSCRNPLTVLDVSNNTALEHLQCEGSQLTTLDLAKNTALIELYCEDNQLTSLDVSKNTSLTHLGCDYNQLTELNVSNNVALTYLRCAHNLLTKLDVSNCAVLTDLQCENNLLTELNVSNTALTRLDCYCNQIKDEAMDALIDGLPENTTGSEYIFRVYETPWSEGNICDKDQVAAAKAKGWTPCYYGELGWQEYEGSFLAINEENFPDENFRAYLLEQDYGADGGLTRSEIRRIARIEVDSRNISSLKGIEFFTALEQLYCPNNQLTDLDVSKNTALTYLYCDTNPLAALDVSNNLSLTFLSCSGNQLTSLDVSRNTALTYLSCANPLTVLDVSNNTALVHLQCESSQLTTLDVSKNTALTLLYCSNNQLTSLDISNNTALTSLYCYSNQLTELNVLNNTVLTYLECYNNQIKGDAMDALIDGLPENTTGSECILRVYDEGGSDGNVCDKDQVADAKAKGWTPYYFSATEWDWREYEGSVLAINEGNFPDDNFRNYLLEQDYGADGGLTRSEIKRITYINVSSRNISSLKGIEFFTALEQLYCNNNQLTDLDVSNNAALTHLFCDVNPLTALDVSNNLSLTFLSCSGNQLTSLDVSRNTALTYLSCRNPLTVLDVSNNTALEHLQCEGSQLIALDLSKNTALTYLDCSQNQLTNLDVSNNAALETFHCYYNQLTDLDVSNNTALTTLFCFNNQLTTLDVSNNTALTVLGCGNNQLTSLDVSNNALLTELGCDNNQLTSLDVSNNTALTRFLRCENNQLTVLDVLSNTVLTYLDCSQNQLTNLDVSNNTALETLYCYRNQIKGDAMDALINSLPENTTGSECILQVYDEGGADGNVCDKDQVANAKAKGWTPYYYSLTEGDWREYEGSFLAINEENFPDENFRAYLLEQDYGADGGLTRSEIRRITYINVSSRNISNLKGIEYFTALEVLYCNNNQLTALDVSNNTALTYLDCAQNQLTALDISSNTILETFHCYSNQLTELNVSSNVALTGIYCNDNQLTSLDVSKNTALIHLRCAYNQLTELNVLSNTALTDLNCNDNQLAALDVSNNLALTELSCSSNQLTALDVSRNTALTQLRCDYNQLTELNVSSNTALVDLRCNDNQLTTLDLLNNPALTNLDCSHNQLTNLDVSNNTALIVLDCYRNQIKDEAMDVLINSLPENTTGEEHILRVYGEPWSDGNVCDKDQVAAAKAKGWTPYYYPANERDWREYEGSFIAIDEVNFPDANFRTYLLEQDYGEDGALTSTEIRRITHIDVSGRNISNLKGMSYFTALTILDCYSNQIKSEAMDVLVGDLPENMTESEHVLRVHAGSASNEGNVITRAQVVAAKVKGWTPYYSVDGQEWQGYRTPPAPTIIYNGRNIRLSTNEDGAKIYYTLDGTSPIDDLGDIGSTTTEYGGEFNVDALCQVRAVTVVDMQNVSEDAVSDIDYLFDGFTAYVRQGNMLEKAFEWCGGMDAVERLAVEGPLSYADVDLLAKAPSLVHLNLSNATLTSGRLPDDAFNGTRLVSFVSPYDLSNAGGSLFANCQQLAAVVWNVDIALSDNTFNGVDNPNLLLYVNNAAYAPSSVKNVIVDGMIESIVLTDKAAGNNNFYCPQAFTVDNISYTRDFKMQTEVGVCRGWETLTLPFTVQTITHERNGQLRPFTAEGDGKPFWLLQMSSGGLESATEIVANRPYLISMPNNKYYLDDYNQNGQVTFAASHVTIEPTEQSGMSGQGIMLVPALQSVAKSAQVYAVNRNAAYGAYVEGSVFVPDYREVRPFEAYTQHPVGSRTLIALSDLMNGSTTAILDLPLKSDGSDAVKVYTLSGVLVTMGQRSEVMKRLSKGVYIINERKIIIK